MATDHLLHNGNYYGYPECCVANFIEYFTMKFDIRFPEQKQKCNTRLPEQIQAAKNGFVPCPEHARQILEKKLKIEDLILPTRKESRAFSKEKQK